MLRIVECDFSSAAHEHLIEELKDLASRGERVFIFVPEQQTLMSEKLVYHSLPPSSQLTVEVTNFTRFVNTALRALGGLGERYCKSAEASLILWRALNQLSPTLELTGGKQTVSIGTVNRVMGAIRDMESLSITPDELLAAAEKITDDRRLEKKLSDLGSVYAAYRVLLRESFSSLNDDLAAITKKLADRPEFISGARIYLDGFTSFTEPQYRLITELMRQCELTVYLTLPLGEGDSFEYSEIKKARRRLTSIADRVGCDKRLIHREGSGTVISDIARLVWHRGAVLDTEQLAKLENERERVRIFEADTPFDECDLVASDIRRRVLLGDSYSDFAIVARNTDSYLGILDTSLDRAGIPYFMSGRSELMSHEAVKLIFTAYRIVSRGFRRDDVITYAKCGMSGISRDEADELELYVEKWSIDGHRFVYSEPWQMNPYGYSEMSEDGLVLLERINGTRDRLLSPLLAFSRDAKAADTVRKQAEILFAFLSGINMEKALYERAKELLDLGEQRAAEECARLWELICSSLDTLVDLTAELPADPDTFANQLSVVLSEASIARLPAVCDSVTVGSADMLRAGNIKHVYLLGVNLGEFPSAVSDTSFFSDKERARLSLSGMPIEPDMEIRSARERYCFSRAFCYGRESVTLLYTKRTSSLSASAPNDVIATISKITADIVKPTSSRSIPLLERIYSPADALLLRGNATAEEDEVIREALEGTDTERVLRVSEGAIFNSDVRLSEESVALLYKGDLYLSQTRLDSFLGCPFSYFCKYGLKLSDSRVAELDASVIGSFIHSILENFFKAITESGTDIGKLGKEERSSIADAAATEYLCGVLSSSHDAPRVRMAIGRLRRAARPVIDSLCEEFANSRFTPVFFELPVGKGGDSNPSPVIYTTRDGGNVVISGIVDRVDSFRHGDDVYVRVIDYKTGNKIFSPNDIKEGENLQMFLYLKAITDTESEKFRSRLGVGAGGRIIPAGVLYVSTSVKDTTVNSASDELAEAAAKDAYVRRGMLLDTEVSLSANNPDFLPNNDDKKTDFKYSEEGWEQIGKDIKNAVLSIAEDMKSGNASASPRRMRSHSYAPCDFCEYKLICRSDK